MTPEEEEARWPEHVRLRSHDGDLNNKRIAIDDFLEWLEEKGYVVAKPDKYNADYVRVWDRPSHLSAEALGADMPKYLAEEQDLIQYTVGYFKNQT